MSNKRWYGPEDRRKQARDPGRTERRRSGRVEYDASGEPVWVEYRSRDNVMDLLLGDQSMDLAAGESKRTPVRTQPNPGAAGKSRDPHEVDRPDRKPRDRKKNLRALSRWITGRKRSGSDTEDGR